MSKPEAATPIRTYLVETDGIGGFRLVRARSQAQARNHVAAETIKVRLATADDGYVAGKYGVAIEEAIEQAVTPPQLFAPTNEPAGQPGTPPADSGDLD